MRSPFSSRTEQGIITAYQGSTFPCSRVSALVFLVPFGSDFFGQPNPAHSRLVRLKRSSPHERHLRRIGRLFLLPRGVDDFTDVKKVHLPAIATVRGINYHFASVVAMTRVSIATEFIVVLGRRSKVS
jgi:hypothetical protein